MSDKPPRARATPQVRPIFSEADYRARIAELAGLAVPNRNGQADRPRFRFFSDQEWAALPPPPWLLHDWLAVGQFAVLFGTSGVGKSFVALDLAYAVARGSAWLGNVVDQPGPVVYIAGEGAVSLRTRAAAYRAYHQVTGSVEFCIVPDAVRLGEPENVLAFTAAMVERYPGGVRLLIFDTWAAALAGLLNEGDTQETTRAIDAVTEIQRASGATALIIHHTGWAHQERERGAYALRAHADLSINLGLLDGAVCVSAVKIRDGPTPPRIPVRLLSIPPSAVVVREDRPREQRPLTEGERAALRCLAEIAGSDGANANDWARASGLPHGTFYRARQRLVELEAVLYERRRYHVTPLGQGVL